jgi:hypothetical protein
MSDSESWKEKLQKEAEETKKELVLTQTILKGVLGAIVISGLWFFSYAPEFMPFAMAVTFAVALTIAKALVSINKALDFFVACEWFGKK